MVDDLLNRLQNDPTNLLAVNTVTALMLFGLVALLATREILFGADRESPRLLLRMERPLDLVIAPLAVVFVLVLVSYAVNSSA